MSGPQIWLYLFTFRPIASKQLNGTASIKPRLLFSRQAMLPEGLPFHQFNLTTIDTHSCLGGAVVTHPLWAQEVPGSIPGSGNGFYV